jgi:hypothetical protein
MLRKNSRLHSQLTTAQYDFLKHAVGAVERLLPHVEVSAWSENDYSKAKAVWASNKRTAIRMTLAIGESKDPKSQSLVATISRRLVGGTSSAATETLDEQEHNICALIAERISVVLAQFSSSSTPDNASIQAIRDGFDEYVVASHLQHTHNLQLPMENLLGALHTLSEQSYENKALTFGCVIDLGKTRGENDTVFPGDFLRSKKYKALSDGFRTAYVVSNDGQVTDFVDLDRYGSKNQRSSTHYFPDWAEPIARASKGRKLGIILGRLGDLLVFHNGTLRFTYRFGRWQYWNHSHLVNLLRDRAKAQKVKKAVLGRVVATIYRVALDVSFRRSGALFVVLHNENNLGKIVRLGDALKDSKRAQTDRDFDSVFANHTIQSLPRRVIVELASLDGAVVLANSGRILAYGAVLAPRRAGKLKGTEGSRTKAAIGASYCGLTLKVSSDGDISIYHDGNEFIRI